MKATEPPISTPMNVFGSATLIEVNGLREQLVTAEVQAELWCRSSR